MSTRVRLELDGQSAGTAARSPRREPRDGQSRTELELQRERTLRQQAEAARDALERQMLHAQKMESLGLLAGGIAHDFNNLLVSVLGNAELAFIETGPASSVAPYLEEIQRAAQRAADLTNQMLAYSGRGRFVIECADLSALTGEMASLLRSAVSRRAELAVSLASGLPAVEVDPTQMRQVIMNLITNASDAVGEAAGRIHVRTGRMFASREYLAAAWTGSEQPAGDYVFVEVADSGCGMDEATLARIFDPFFTTKASGRGLGLAAVLAIVRSHKGAITISSTPGQGTSFRVLLPAAQAPAGEAPAADPESGSIGAGGAVLVVDDEETVRRVAAASLRRAGFRVETVPGGEEAIARLQADDSSFDAILADMSMPRLSGVDLARHIVALRPGLPIVLTSGYSECEASARAAETPIAGFIQKPFVPSALGQLMRAVIEQKRAGVSAAAGAADPAPAGETPAR